MEMIHYFKTNNLDFDSQGYYLVNNLYDPKELYCEVPKERGQIKYFGSEKKFNYKEKEDQVNGSLARYSHPKYKFVHSQIKLKIEKIIGKKLFDTYYYDRFYFAGQELTPHVDRPACEISVSVNISTNLNEYWPFKIETPNKEIHSLGLDPGDGVIYRGCDRRHWRDPMPSRYSKFEKIKNKFYNKEDDSYYHQIFFHYVLADGYRCEYAYDRCS